MASRLTYETKAKILSLIQEGKTTFQDIASKLGISIATVYVIAKGYGVKPPRKNLKITPEMQVQICNLALDRSKSLIDIAKLFNVTPTSIANVLKRYNVVRPRK